MAIGATRSAWVRRTQRQGCLSVFGSAVHRFRGLGSALSRASSGQGIIGFVDNLKMSFQYSISSPTLFGRRRLLDADYYVR